MTLKLYKYISLGMATTFGVAGILFLFTSDEVLAFFNRVSIVVGMEEVEPAAEHFYVILAVAYMYIVALLAFLMYRKPEEAAFPFILINAKIATSVVSILFFFIDKLLLIYITNGVVDGLIALLVILMYRSLKKLFQ